jgi:hypothetical protein
LFRGIYLQKQLVKICGKMKFFKVIILSVVWSSGDNLEDYDQDSQDSQDSQASQDDHYQDQDHPMLPPHEFIVKKTMWKTGKKKVKRNFLLHIQKKERH